MFRIVKGIVFLAIMMTPLAALGVPSAMQFEGYLTDDDGLPIAGAHDVAFSIYDAAEGGNLLWTETHTVAVEGGAFTAWLGETNPLDANIFTGDAVLYLGVAVDGNAEMSPRQKIGSVPYASRADAATSAQAVDWSAIDGVPEGFADETDDTRSDADILALIAGEGYLSAADLTDYATRVWVSENHYSRADVDALLAAHYSAAEIDDLLLGYAAVTHNHDAAYAALAHNHDADYADAVHDHNATYFTKPESDSRFSQSSHQHDTRYYTEAEADARFSPGAHGHDAADIATGTLAVERYSAIMDLYDEGMVGSGVGKVAPGYHNHNATHINEGTLSPNRYSAYADLEAETKIGTAAGQLSPGDHEHEQYARFMRTLIIPADGTAAENGQALLDAAGTTDDSDTDNRYLIQLDAGHYDLGANTLTLTNFVSLRGAGRTATVLVGAGTDAGLIFVHNVDSYTRISDMRIYHTGMTDTVKTISSAADELYLSELQVITRGTLDNSLLSAVTTMSFGNVTVDNCILNVASELGRAGILSGINGQGEITVRNSDISLYYGLVSDGITKTAGDHSVRVSSTFISAIGSQNSSIGIELSESSVDLYVYDTQFQMRSSGTIFGLKSDSSGMHKIQGIDFYGYGQGGVHGAYMTSYGSLDIGNSMIDCHDAHAISGRAEGIRMLTGDPVQFGHEKINIHNTHIHSWAFTIANGIYVLGTSRELFLSNVQFDVEDIGVYVNNGVTKAVIGHCSFNDTTTAVFNLSDGDVSVRHCDFGHGVFAGEGTQNCAAITSTASGSLAFYPDSCPL